MDDSVSRKVTLNALSELRSKYNCFDEHEEPVYHALSEAIKALSQPERKTGKWIVEGRTTKWYACSECRGAGDWRDNYCKHCGAKMEVEQDEQQTEKASTNQKNMQKMRNQTCKQTRSRRSLHEVWME